MFGKERKYNSKYWAVYIWRKRCYKIVLYIWNLYLLIYSKACSSTFERQSNAQKDRNFGNPKCTQVWLYSCHSFMFVLLFKSSWPNMDWLFITRKLFVKIALRGCENRTIIFCECFDCQIRIFQSLNQIVAIIANVFSNDPYWGISKTSFIIWDCNL